MIPSHRFPQPLSDAVNHEISRPSISLYDSTLDYKIPSYEIVDHPNEAADSKVEYTDDREPDIASQEDIVKKMEDDEIISISMHDEGTHDPNYSGPRCEGQGVYQSIKKLTVEKSQKYKENVKKKRDKRVKKVLEILFDSKKQEIMVKVESCIKDSKERSIEYLTRRELVEEDPKLLLYFYERHLEFRQMPEFQTSDLQNL